MAEQIGSFEAASYRAEIEALLDPAKLPKRGNGRNRLRGSSWR